MSVNIPAKMEELFICFLREESLRRSLDRELGLLRLGAWTPAAASLQPKAASSMRSPPVARHNTPLPANGAAAARGRARGGATAAHQQQQQHSQFAEQEADGPQQASGSGGGNGAGAEVGQRPASPLDAATAPAPASTARPTSPLASMTRRPSPPPASLGEIAAKRPSRTSVPRFFPTVGSHTISEMDQMLLDQVKEAFGEDDLVLHLEDFELIAKVCGLSTYLAADLFHACGGRGEGGVSISSFTAFWKQLATDCTSTHEKVMRLLSPRGGKLEPAHFRRMVRFVLDTHPGLEFLLESPQYHERYIDTVIARMFYAINRWVVGGGEG